MMILTALYIAIGSGFPSLRAYFEMDNLQFFDAWPLKVLMGLLITSLVVVTWRRIPLTPPRYGVWCVHIGIITLILGTCFYYNRKIEGTVRLYTQPQYGPVSATTFYDSSERSLYLKIDGALWNSYPMPSLPRYNAYDALLGNSGSYFMRGGDLKHIVPSVDVRDDPDSPPIRRTLSQALGWKNKLGISVVGYYPYATVDTRFDPSPDGHTAGFRLTLPEMKDGNGFETWLIASEPHYQFIMLPGTDTVLEHRQVASVADITKIVTSAAKLFRLDITDHGTSQTLFVQPGQTYKLKSGDVLEIENYNPAWSMFGTGEIVQALTMKITTPAQTFRRMVLQGQPVQTDFKLNIAGAGPMGKRQSSPIDPSLDIKFIVADPYHLLPDNASAKQLLLTAPKDKDAVNVFTSLSSLAMVRTLAGGVGNLPISPADSNAAPFAQSAAATPAHPAFPLHVQLQRNFLRDDSIQIVPSAKRTRQGGTSGAFQVVRVRLTMGKWSQDVVVPYAIDAGDQPWDGGTVKLPTGNELQLQLGQMMRPLPAKLTLEKFNVIPYPGGNQSAQSIDLDYRSTVTVEDPATGDSTTEVAHLNNPIYYRHGDWLFFQAAYDGNAHHWTVLGVGNRDGVDVMILGCIMIVTGLMYAFYLKPIIIRRMKASAIKRAAKRKLELIEV